MKLKRALFMQFLNYPINMHCELKVKRDAFGLFFTVPPFLYTIVGPIYISDFCFQGRVPWNLSGLVGFQPPADYSGSAAAAAAAASGAPSGVGSTGLTHPHYSTGAYSYGHSSADMPWGMATATSSSIAGTMQNSHQSSAGAASTTSSTSTSYKMDPESVPPSMYYSQQVRAANHHLLLYIR